MHPHLFIVLMFVAEFKIPLVLLGRAASTHIGGTISPIDVELLHVPFEPAQLVVALTRALGVRGGQKNYSSRL
jgi:hypothetical protein